MHRGVGCVCAVGAATAVDAPLAFSAYGAAVDREECASHAYAFMKRTATTLSAERADPPGMRAGRPCQAAPR